MTLGKFFALVSAVMTFILLGATNAAAAPSGVGLIAGDLLLSEFDSASLTYTVNRQASDGTATRLFAIKGQLGPVFSGGGKIGVRSAQEVTVKGKEMINTVVWDITSPGGPAVVARATYTIQKGSKKYGCGSEVDLAGIMSTGQFVVRSAKRQRHAKPTKCVPEYLAKKRKLRVKARNRVSITAISTQKIVVMQTSLLAPDGSALSPLFNAPQAKAAGSRLVTWDSSSLSVRDIASKARPTSFKLDPDIQPMSVDIGESGNVIAAGTTKERKGFLVTGKTKLDLPIQFSGEAYMCGDRIVEIARSPVVIEGRVTNELAALEWSLQGTLQKKTSIGSNHFIAAFACDAITAYGVRQTVPAKTAQLITIKLG